MLFSLIIAGLTALQCVSASPMPNDASELAKKPAAPKCGKTYKEGYCTYKVYCNAEITSSSEPFTDGRPSSLAGCIQDCYSYEGQCVGATYDTAFSPGVCELYQGTISHAAAKNSTAIVQVSCEG